MPNYLRHLKNLYFKGSMMPEYVVLYVTDACNLACLHCFYYEDLNKARTIKLGNLEKLAKSMNHVVNISFTGGEPFILPHLPMAVKLFHEHSGLEVASIPTNGILQDKVLKATETICRENSRLNVNIDISLDGLEKTHDYIRAKPGGYQTSVETLGMLVDLKKKYDNLNVGVIATINKANEDEIIPLFEEVQGRFDINQFLVNFVRGNTKELNPSTSTLKKYKEAHRFIHQKLLDGESKGYGIFMSGLYNAVSMRVKKTIVDTLATNSFQTQCYAGTTNAIIKPDGRVQACEMRTDVDMGDLNDYDWDLGKLLEDKKAQDIRAEILPSDCFCSFECQASCNTAYNPLELSKSVIDLFRMKAGLMSNHFEGGISDMIPVDTRLRSKDTKGILGKTAEH